MNPPNDPRPQCPECGIIIHPESRVVTVAEGDSDDLPDGIDLPIVSDIFAGLYCSGDCILDALRRGWPESRSLKD